MFRRIVVALDGSGFAEAALPVAYSLADRSRGEIRLVSVDDPEGFEASSDDADRIHDYLGDVVRRVGKTWRGVVSTAVLEGSPADGIDAEMKAWDADLLVMATHGRGGLSRAWMGSVADRCIRSARRPVLAVHPTVLPAPVDRPAVIDKIVVPLDGSEVAEAALPTGIELAHALGIPLTVVRAVPPASPSQFYYLPELIAMSRQIDEDARERANAYVRDVVMRLRNDDIHPSGSVISDAGAAEAILSQAAGGGLVVMTTHGRGGLDRIVLGSTADKVVRAGDAPVLVIPTLTHHAAAGASA